MNNDIKVLLNSLQNIVETIDIRPRSDNFTNINDSDIKLLLDYITNLQEENEKLKERVQIGQNAFLSLSRKIDKAIEYITYWHYRNDFRANSFTMGVKENLLNILQGEDNTLKIKNSLQERIDKALDYIKSQQIIFKDYDIVVETQLKILKNLLQGEDKQ